MRDGITTVLFDLDGTLLPMDMEVFVKDYAKRLSAKLQPHGYEAEQLVPALWEGIHAMVRNDGSRKNEAVFWESFGQEMRRDVRKDEPLFMEFYEKEFQEVAQVCGCNPQAAELVTNLKAQGFRVILATNPVFAPIATHSRIRWAGIDPAVFDYITTYDNSSFCKPNLLYYKEILAKLGLEAQECLMVGNDVAEDMIAERLGMDVFLLTDCLLNRENLDITRYPQGGFEEFKNYIEV